MTLAHSEIPLKFSPFHAVLHGGIDRLFELLQPEDFTFTIRGEAFKSTLAEAVLISPMISERLKSDPTNRQFDFGRDEFDSNIFSIFLDLIRCRSEFEFSHEHELVFLSVCKLLGNDQFCLILLHSIHFTHSIDSIDSDLTSDAMKSADFVSVTSIDYDDCASQFGSYSVDELRCLSKESLLRLLSSESLSIESEVSLLQTLIDLG
jgi:hypothetical protein